MTLKSVTQILFNREIRRAQGEQPSSDAKSSKKSVGRAYTEDTATISEEARQIHATETSRAVSDVAQVSGQNAVKDLDQIKERVSSGYYDRPEVVEEVASALVRSGDLSESGSGQEKLDSVRERIKQGFYDQQQLIEDVAIKLLGWLNR